MFRSRAEWRRNKAPRTRSGPMPDDAPREFPVTVTVDGRVSVTVVLLLKAGTEVAVKETKVETKPERSSPSTS